MNLNTVGGRRFLVVTIVLLINAVLLWFTKLDVSGYTTLCLGIVLGFIGGNTLQEVTKLKESK